MTINGRKSQGSGVVLRICFSCAVQWKEKVAVKWGACVQSFPRHVWVDSHLVFHMSASVNLAILLKFYVTLIC